MNDTLASQLPSVGRIVHFVLPNSEHRAAMVVKIFCDDGSAQLQVFTDGSNDNSYCGDDNVRWETSVRYSEGNEPRTWHWPERV